MPRPPLPTRIPSAREEARRILGVDINASREDIKTAYRKIARECHPDVAGGDPAAAERFMRATKAYETLIAWMKGSRKAATSSLPLYDPIQPPDESQVEASAGILQLRPPAEPASSPEDKRIIYKITTSATRMLQSQVGPLWYRLNSKDKEDLEASALEKWLSKFDLRRLRGRPSEETNLESIQILRQAARDAWNESRAEKERERATGDLIEKVGGIGETTAEDILAYSQTTNAQLERMSLIDEIARQPAAGVTKANILRMHMGEQVLPHQPSSTIGRYGGNSYSSLTSKAYSHLYGERWIFKVGGILYRPTGIEGISPSYHGPPLQSRVVMIDERPMMILKRPRSDVRGEITLLPLDDARQTVQIQANPLELSLAPCPTCEDIARFLRIKGLTGPRVQQFIDVDFARMAREKGFDIFSTKEN